MRIGRETELQCPRCRVVAVRGPGRQERCTHCGARLEVADALAGQPGLPRKARPLGSPRGT